MGDDGSDSWRNYSSQGDKDQYASTWLWAIHYERWRNHSNMLDRFAKITNGLASLSKPALGSDKVKKILHSLPKEWDTKVATLTKAKN